MDLDNNDSKKKKTKSNKLLEKLVGFVNFGLIILIIGLVGFYIYQNYVAQQGNGNLEKSESNAGLKSEIESDIPVITIFVDISGEVKSPGVYEVNDGARVIDILEKSGGFTDKVDLDYVEKNINKAEKLIDSQKIYIPSLGEPVADASSAQQINPSANSDALVNQNGTINVNTASRQQLIDLPEIGESTADKIISARPYSNIDELVAKGAMKKSSLDKIRSLIRV